MKYGRVVDNVIVEIVEPINGFTAEHCFHPDILAQCIDLGDAQLGWVKKEDGTFGPLEPVEPAPIVVEAEQSTPATDESVVDVAQEAIFAESQ